MARCSELSKGMCILGETSRDDVLTQRHTPVLVELQMQRSVGLSPQILAGGRLKAQPLGGALPGRHGTKKTAAWWVRAQFRIDGYYMLVIIST